MSGWSDLLSKHIQFQPFTPKDIVRISEVEVSTPELYENKENAASTTKPGGPLDGKMVSTVSDSTKCRDQMRKALNA